MVVATHDLDGSPVPAAVASPIPAAPLAPVDKTHPLAPDDYPGLLKRLALAGVSGHGILFMATDSGVVLRRRGIHRPVRR